MDYDKHIKETFRRERAKKAASKVKASAEKATKEREKAPKSNTSSEKRLSNRNLRQSAKDISPKLASTRKADSAKRLASSNARQADYAKGPNMGGGTTKNTDTSYRMAKAEPKKEQSFGAAFAGNRKASEKSFMWKGKKYTTDLASDKKDTSFAKTKEGNYGSATNMDTSKGPTMSATNIDTSKGPSMSVSAKTTSNKRPDDMQRKAQKALQPGQPEYKKGGSVRKTDGCSVRGRTKGRMI